MKKIRVSRATPLQLDWLVAKCKGIAVEVDEGVVYLVDRPRDSLYANYNPSSNWRWGGPILSKARISRTIDHSGLWIAYWTDGYTDGDEGKKWMQCHRSELVAGLRCLVASRLGEIVEVPEELT